MRIDKYMADAGLAVSRAKAQEMLKEGCVTVNGTPVNKASFDVLDGMEVLVKENPLQRYVGRGGLKLEGALDAFALSPEGQVALDIGASSGGFTDCLLKRGAACVYAVDSGCGQLHPSLLADERVISMENTNARTVTRASFEKTPTFTVMDVSFISQTLILPAIRASMPSGGTLISLIKPQFELGRGAIGKGGIVKSEALAKTAVTRVCDAAKRLGFRLIGHIPSPIRGGDGNLEFLAAFSLDAETEGKNE